jgi:hypothetical protein
MGVMGSLGGVISEVFVMNDSSVDFWSNSSKPSKI